MKIPALSVIIPACNGEGGFAALSARLYPVPDTLSISYEVVFTNDGSRDRSAVMLAGQFRTHPDSTRVVLFNGNYGQRITILAGFEYACSEHVATLDTDLQNPPEKIGHLIKKLDEGYDYVSTIHHMRQDSWFRRTTSCVTNSPREYITHTKMTDQGCILRTYNCIIVGTINRCHEVSTSIPALAHIFSKNPTEIEVNYEERSAGESKYLLYKLVRLNFDLVTGPSAVPLQ